MVDDEKKKDTNRRLIFIILVTTVIIIRIDKIEKFGRVSTEVPGYITRISCSIDLFVSNVIGRCTNLHTLRIFFTSCVFLIGKYYRLKKM